ncbi:MAG: ATP-dependent DNA ligase [Candidatus Nanopelagicales bacterium]
MTLRLPVLPPVSPMLAKPTGARVPAPDSVAGGLAYEPKWDGFRCVLFRDGDDVVVQGRSGDDLAYAFPEMVDAARRLLPERVVLDGELVVVVDDRLSFESLTKRIRPRKEAGGWKIAELAEQWPTSYVAFDLLADDDTDLRERAYADRRDRLEQLLHTVPAPFHLTPVTRDPDEARRWFEVFEGAGLDGVIAKPLADPYREGVRALLKVKHARTADVVVAGWRAHKQPGPDGQPVVGSLLLGLYDDAGRLHHVGVASSFTAARRADLVDELAAYALDDLSEHPWSEWADAQAHASGRMPGAVSRWTGGKDLSWTPLRPDLVAEVGYDHLEGDRFRHVAQWKRWRPDRDPLSCTYDQLERPVRFDLASILGDT